MGGQYKIAFIGAGSIGVRHLLNTVEVLKERGIGCSIDLIRSGYGMELDERVNTLINQVYQPSDPVPEDYDVIFITNPTYLHFDTIQRYHTKTKHMFIEKPVFDRADIQPEALGLNETGVYYVACPLRYTEVIQYLKKACDLSNTYCVRVICSSYLPDWRPGKDYRNTYSAQKEQGGGVSIDLIHEWDYICYLFGQPEQVQGIRGKFSNLEIDSDDLSIYIARYQDMAVEVHLDYFGRKSIREIQIFTDKDTIVGDILNSEVRFLKSGEVISLKEGRNDFYRKEIEHFFDMIEGRAVNDNDIASALRTLTIAQEGKV